MFLHMLITIRLCKVMIKFTFHNTITKGNGYKLFKHFSHLNVRKFSFAKRIIDDWNQLLTFLIESPDILTFKTKLDIFWNAYT